MKTTHGREEYVVSDTVAPDSPCRVPNADVVSDCGLPELPSSIHSDDKTEHDAFFVQTDGRDDPPHAARGLRGGTETTQNPAPAPAPQTCRGRPAHTSRALQPPRQ